MEHPKNDWKKTGKPILVPHFWGVSSESEREKAVYNGDSDGV